MAGEARGVVVGVDGGGTKTDARVADVRTGAVLGEGHAGCGNWESAGVDGMTAAVRDAVEAALRQAGAALDDVAAAHFALAGVDWPSDDARVRAPLAAIGLTCPIGVSNDSLAAMRAGAAEPWGLVSAVGTGSVSAGRNRAGETARSMAIGWGEPNGASSVASRALHAVAAAHTGNGAPTALTDAVCSHAGFDGPAELFEAISRRGHWVGAEICPLVFAIANGGDPVARQIIGMLARQHAAVTAAIGRRLRMHLYPHEVVLAGRVHRSDDALWRTTFQSSVREGLPLARFVLLSEPPVTGAVSLALDALAGRVGS